MAEEAERLTAVYVPLIRDLHLQLDAARLDLAAAAAAAASPPLAKAPAR